MKKIAVTVLAHLLLSSMGAAVEVTVKESAGVGATDYPVSVMIPFPQGSTLGTAVVPFSPSQSQVMDTWPDGSLRHALVSFQASMNANGSTSGGSAGHSQVVSVVEGPGEILVNTGPLRFTVSKQAFNLFDQVWLDTNGDGSFQDGERVIAHDTRNGGIFVGRPGTTPLIQRDSDQAAVDLNVSLEETGPVRAVIRVEARTRYSGEFNHVHGWCVRIYAYAGQSYVKVDYQLQNSSLDAMWTGPLYFEEMNLDFRLNLTNPSVRFGMGSGNVYPVVGGLGTGSYLAQEDHASYRVYRGVSPSADILTSGSITDVSVPNIGFIDVSDGVRGVMATTRNFWQTWANGLEVDGSGKLSVQLFPRWSHEWWSRQSGLNPTGLYWLNDMQHVYKEVMFYFHGPSVSDGALVNLAKTFAYPPVPVLPLSVHKEAKASLDMGGAIPNIAALGETDTRVPSYPADWFSVGGNYYGFNWVNFGDPEPQYRASPCTTGGTPYGAGKFLLTGNRGDYFKSEEFGIGEMNIRPQWLAGYTHAAHYNAIQPDDGNYCAGDWRRMHMGTPGGHDYLPGTETFIADPSGDAAYYGARDDEHGWFYHVEESYNQTGNPWIKDWYKFIGQYRQERLRGLEPYTDTSARAIGHSVNNSLQAYRVTSDMLLLQTVQDYFKNYLRPWQDPFYGDQRNEIQPGGGGFQTGYQMSAAINFIESVRDSNPQAWAEGFNYLSGLAEWNLNFGNFPYYFNARTEPGPAASRGEAAPLIDPQSWYYWHTGKRKYMDQVETYMASGINGGQRPFGIPEYFTAPWKGAREGRWYFYARSARPDAAPPAAVTDLTAIRSGSAVLLNWTTPADAARFHIVWSTKPLYRVANFSDRESTTDASYSNWWAANPVGPSLTPQSGARQGLTILASPLPVYVAIFTFDAAENMSLMSNVALAVTGQIPLPARPRRLRRS